MMFAAGWLLVNTIFSGVTTKVLGATPKVHCNKAPLHTCIAMIYPPNLRPTTYAYS